MYKQSSAYEPARAGVSISNAQLTNGKLSIATSIQRNLCDKAANLKRPSVLFALIC